MANKDLHSLESALAQLAERHAAETAQAVRSFLSRLLGASPASTAAAAPASNKAPSKAKGAGGRRRKGSNDADVNQALAYIQANPDQRSEQIARALHFDAKKMFKALAALRGSKRVIVRGYGRGGTYRVA